MKRLSKMELMELVNDAFNEVKWYGEDKLKRIWKHDWSDLLYYFDAEKLFGKEDTEEEQFNTLPYLDLSGQFCKYGICLEQDTKMIYMLSKKEVKLIKYMIRQRIQGKVLKTICY